MTLYEQWMVSGPVATVAPDLNFKVLPVRMNGSGPDGDIVSYSGRNAWYITSGAKNPDAAWEFIAYMHSDETWTIGADAVKEARISQVRPYFPSFTSRISADQYQREELYESVGPAFDEAVEVFAQIAEVSRNREISKSPVAYAFARLRFPGRSMFFALVIGTYLLPGSVIMIPTFLIWNELGLVNTLFPLWAGNLFGSAFYIFMIRQFMLTVPQDLMDAARLDGASFFRIYWSIMLPLVRPALAAVAIFEFNAKWNDFMGHLIYLNDPDRYTLALGMATLKANFQELGTSWSLLLTASVIFTIPMIVIFFLFQRYFIEGVAQSGIKG